MASKTFKVAAGEAVEFSITGTNLLDGREFVAGPFECRPRIPAGVVLEFSEALEGSSTGGKQIVSVVNALLESALQPVALTQFRSVINDPDLGVDLGALVEVCDWLAGQYSGGRPTGGASSDGSKAPQSGPTSTPGGPSIIYPSYSRPETAPQLSTPAGSSTSLNTSSKSD